MKYLHEVILPLSCIAYFAFLKLILFYAMFVEKVEDLDKYMYITWKIRYDTEGEFEIPMYIMTYMYIYVINLNQIIVLYNRVLHI